MLWQREEQSWCIDVVNKRQLTAPLRAMIDKSVNEIKENSKAIEEALEKFLAEEGIEVSEKEFMEIKQLTDTMNELDNALFILSQPSKKKTEKKSSKKKVGKKKSKKK